MLSKIIPVDQVRAAITEIMTNCLGHDLSLSLFLFAARPRPHKDENFLHSAVINNRCPIPANEVFKGKNVRKLHPSWE